MERIEVLPMGPHEYSVQLREGGVTTTHQVTVPAGLLADLGQPDLEEVRLVSESFAFLLDREKPTEILPSFSLDVIPRYFPDYLAELRARLA